MDKVTTPFRSEKSADTDSSSQILVLPRIKLPENSGFFTGKY